MKSASRSPTTEPALPAWKAFVIQFSRETIGARGTFAGRVEHLTSGWRAHFESPEQLVAVMGRLIEELGKAPP